MVGNEGPKTVAPNLAELGSDSPRLGRSAARFAQKGGLKPTWVTQSQRLPHGIWGGFMICALLGLSKDAVVTSLKEGKQRYQRSGGPLRRPNPTSEPGVSSRGSTRPGFDSVSQYFLGGDDR